MNNSPLVSIIVPSYNHSEYIEDTINSIINQDYENIELIIIDDGSTDDSVEKIKSLSAICKKRFYRFESRSRKNIGLCDTLNEAITWCKGEYLSICASDDMYLPEKTSYQVNYLQINKSAIGVFGGVSLIYELSKETIQKPVSNKEYKFNDILLHKHNLLAPTHLLRMEKVRGTGGFKSGFIIEDWMMWLLLTERGGSLDCVNKTFSFYRRHDNNVSNNLEVMHQGRLQVLELFNTSYKYKKAVCRVYRMYAEEIIDESPEKAKECLMKGLKYSPLSILSKSYIKLILKLIKN